MGNRKGARPSMTSATGALNWMRQRISEPGEVLFRGQSEIYPTIYPSLVRGNVTEKDRNAWWSVTRQFIGTRNGLNGYQIEDPHDALAVVQHYLVKSPVLDLTGTPEVALYFALMNKASQATRVVYAVETEALKEAKLVVTDHAFLALPLAEGGSKHRWLRQDGYTVGHPVWESIEGAYQLDFARLPGVESLAFKLQPGEEELVRDLGDLESVNDDPLASRVRSHFESIAMALDCQDAVMRLMPITGTVDTKNKLIAAIEDLILHANLRGSSEEDLLRLEQLRIAAGSSHWDTSWYAELDSSILKLRPDKPVD